MSIYIRDGWAFVDMKQGYMLCIGTKKDVDEADSKKLVEMIQEAIVVSKYRSITSSQHQVLM